MAYDFDETAPADNDYISDFPDNERAARKAKKDAFEVDHELTNGFHEQCTLTEQGADVDPPADVMALYTKDDGGQPELFAQEESAGGVIQITKDGFIHQVVSTLAAAPEAQRKMLANLLLLNAKLIQGENAATGTYFDLLGLNASDEVDVGDSDAGTVQALRLKVADDVADPEEKFVVEYGAGDKQLYHEGNKGDAATVGGYAATGLLLSSDTTVAGRFFTDSGAPSAVPAGSAELTVAHGLGGVPRIWTVCLRCTAVDADYAVDDELRFDNIHIVAASGTDEGCSCYANATNVVMRMGSNRILFANDKTGWDVKILTLAKWVVVMRAWR